ncbi:MAG TPA: peptidoglycan recognition family protein [Thermoanaerobaculia bacterium]|mgnify:FL=1|nr:peptidoglycan recognition family protein [Thermoanaerobaculia bacterium]
MTRKWSEILIHHSATSGRSARTWEAIRRDHSQRRGWRDIGYHYGIGIADEVPTVLPGRPESMIGSHCPGKNSTALGVCFLGDFTWHPPEDDVLLFGAGLLAGLCERHGISHRRIHPHRQFRATECPGLAFPFDRLLELVVEELEDF